MAGVNTQRVAALENLRRQWKARFEDAWRAGDYEFEAIALNEVRKVDEEIQKALKEAA